MKEKIEINTMTARNVFSSESFRFVQMIVKKIGKIDIPTQAKEIHKQNKPHDYTDEFRLYGTTDQGIKYHSLYKVLDKESTSSIFTITNETFGFNDFRIKFTISSQDGLLLEIESEKSSIIDEIKSLFEKEFGYCKQQSKEEIFDELLHEMRTRGTENDGEVGITLGLKAIQFEPRDFWAQFYLGCSYALNNQHEKAIDHLNMAIIIDSSNYDAYYNIAKSYLQLTELEKALGAIKQAKSLAQSNHVITYYYAIILEKLGKKKEAIEMYKETISLSPERNALEPPPTICYSTEAEDKLKQLQEE